MSMRFSRRAPKPATYSEDEQPDLFGKEAEAQTGQAEDTSPAGLSAAVERLREKAQALGEARLLPVRHPNRDFFVCDFVDYPFKDDQASMEAPFFSLATKPDTRQWVWRSQDGKRRMTVTPSVLGRATIMDKDVLIYVISQVIAGLNEGRADARSRAVRFTVHDYLTATNRQVGGSQYEQLADALRRLQGTSIETDIETGGQRVRRGFGLIEWWEIVERSPDDQRMVAIEVMLAPWLHNALQAREILTISPNYFRLRRPLERRLYELARKHCGNQPAWRVNSRVLHAKTGSRAEHKEFWRLVREIERSDLLPDYHLHTEEAGGVQGERFVTIQPKAKERRRGRSQSSETAVDN